MGGEFARHDVVEPAQVDLLECRGVEQLRERGREPAREHRIAVDVRPPAHEFGQHRATLQGADRRAIQAAGQRVDALTAPFAQRRIERDLARAIQGRMSDEVAEKLGLDDAEAPPA